MRCRLSTRLSSLVAVITVLTLTWFINAVGDLSSFEIEAGDRVITLRDLTTKLHGRGKEVYVDRRFTNDRVIIPPGRYSCDELLRLIALANGLEVRHVGKVKFLSPSGQDNIDPEVAEHLEDSLEEKLKDLLAYETARLKDEAIPFDLVDFLNERTFSWPNLTPRQQQFVQRMADAKIAEKNQRRMHANQPAGAMPGAPTADSPGVSASPLPRSRDLGKIRNLRVCLEPAYEVAITRYLLRQSGDARPRVYSPYETVSLIVE